MTFLLEVRNAASECTNVDYRAFLREAANDLDNAISELDSNPTRENAKAMNAAWAFAERLLKNRPEEGTPAPLSGSPEPPLLRMAA